LRAEISARPKKVQARGDLKNRIAELLRA